MNSIIQKCGSSLKPCGLYGGLKRLLTTSQCQFTEVGSKSPSVDDPIKTAEPEHHKDSHDQSKYESDVKKKILDASLQFVSVHGWSKSAISAGAETLGYPGVIHGMFPRGGFDLIQHFYTTSNQRLIDILIKEYEESLPPEGKLVDSTNRERLEKAVRTRLEMIIPYMKQWPQALATMTLPPNVPTALANLLCLVDDIFYYTGDTSVDMSWYSRRIVLAGIYKSTELYMLQDGSVDYTNSWEFLRRRMDEASQARAYMKASEQATQVAKDLTTSAFITARNILGLSWNR